MGKGGISGGSEQSVCSSPKGNKFSGRVFRHSTPFRESGWGTLWDVRRSIYLSFSGGAQEPCVGSPGQQHWWGKKGSLAAVRSVWNIPLLRVLQELTLTERGWGGHFWLDRGSQTDVFLFVEWRLVPWRLIAAHIWVRLSRGCFSPAKGTWNLTLSLGKRLTRNYDIFARICSLRGRFFNELLIGCLLCVSTCWALS